MGKKHKTPPDKRTASPTSAEPSVPAEMPLLFKIALGLVLALAVAFIALFLYVSLSRIRYPFDLEWLEGSMVVNVQRVFDGQSPYVEPSQDFTCYHYPPLYYWTSALACLPFGVGYFPLRLVSVLSTAGTFILLFLIVRRETKSLVLGIIAGGTYAAAYGCLSDWFDLARNDSLFIFWLVAGLYAVRRPKADLWTSAPAALLFLLAFFTKQPAIFVVAGAAFYLTLVNWRQGLLLIALFAGGTVIATLLLDWSSQGWYSFYAFKLAGEHPFVLANILGFWKNDLLLVIPVWLIAALGFACFELTGWRDRRRLYFPLIVSSAFAGCWISRLHESSVPNVNMPAYAVMAMTLPLALHALGQRLSASADRRLSALALVAAVAVIAQFGVLFHNPAPRIPTKADEAAGWKFIDYLRGVQGDVFIPCSTYYAAMAGKKTFSHTMTTMDILMAKNEVLKKKLQTELVEALKQKKYAAVILPANDFGFAATAQKFNYHEVPFGLFDNDTVFQPIIGNMAVRPSRVFVPPPSKNGLGLLRNYP